MPAPVPAAVAVPLAPRGLDPKMDGALGSRRRKDEDDKPRFEASKEGMKIKDTDGVKERFKATKEAVTIKGVPAW